MKSNHDEAYSWANASLFLCASFLAARFLARSHSASKCSFRCSLASGIFLRSTSHLGHSKGSLSSGSYFDLGNLIVWTVNIIWGCDMHCISVLTELNCSSDSSNHSSTSAIGRKKPLQEFKLRGAFEKKAALTVLRMKGVEMLLGFHGRRVHVA
jgi:hypothetical protein